MFKRFRKRLKSRKVRKTIERLNLKVTSMHRSFYKKQMAPKGYQHIIVRIKDLANGKVIEGSALTATKNSKKENAEVENHLVELLYDRYIK